MLDREKKSKNFTIVSHSQIQNAHHCLSLIGVGRKEADRFVEGTLQIGNTVLSQVRLWIAPVNLKKMLLGNDVLSKVAKIELEYANLRRARGFGMEYYFSI